MNWFYRFFYGFLLLEVSGQYPEQLLNIAASNGISVWGLHRNGENLCVFMAANSFCKLRPFIRGTHLRIRVKEKKGLPFLLRPYRFRYGLFFGAVFCVVVLFVLSNFIWIIEVDGNQKTQTNEILSVCKEMNIHIGIPKRKINSGVQSQKLLLNCPELSWASLNVEGSVLTVNVTERKDSEKDKIKLPSNLKASQDGIIEKLDIVSGNPTVSVGQTVSKGEVLVSGIMTIGEQTVFCAAEGEVVAEVRMNFEEHQPLKTKKMVENKSVFSRFGLEFFGIKIPLYVGTVKGNYDIQKTEYPCFLFQKELPIRLHLALFRGLNEKSISITPEKAKEMCLKRIEKRIEDQQLKEISVLEENCISNEGEIIIKRVVKGKKNIALQEVILFDERN